ncbi:MAG: DUF302 domain-containing protein [Chromatiaceae bacterium]|nr:DUF302 domain-containing protein [Chromatiaceae bacterium]MCP5315362.1 DUF302 domain-containing protein [Chromatiaceae bacterium]
MNRWSGFVMAVSVIGTAGVGAADGLTTQASAHSVPVTMDRLENAVTAAGFKVFARVDHGAGAKSVDMPLAPTELLIFGKPDAGTLLMQSAASVGIDLPLKYLVWQDTDGKVTVGWNDPAWLVARHGISDRAPVVQKMTGALKKFADEATKP